ncbi:hypothetical protein FB565_003852 [Actinoplanes lutulentus]|uniref:Uncharacterized protein n=1 Tax=Actinoplanes lutulentus TaxID=1287878 RepID=A0A327ZN88_9ACTN|nr:hypothetical protein [Actinoplanes lutulentus]MBB2944123.1 hypothetical protein [Actinoplanes lutulentus]RAK42644.1 hypothetical protein B0I29_102469 [Actinoplanes lutulentus]
MLGTHLLVAATVLASGAQAPVVRGPVTEMTFAVSPDAVTKGSRITLAGEAGAGDSGNAGPVDLYFRKSEDDAYARIGRIAASATGRFSTTLTATTSGDYQAVYRGNKKRGEASGSDYLAVYTTRTVKRLIYTWKATNMQCAPVCRAHSPELTLGQGPVHLSFQRDCGQTRSGGSLGFTPDPWNKHEPGDPGWRDFPDGAGPAEFDLAPTKPAGHFYVTWSSVAREPGQPTRCQLSYTATQTATEIAYV